MGAEASNLSGSDAELIMKLALLNIALQGRRPSTSSRDANVVWDPKDCSDNLKVSDNGTKVTRGTADDRTDMVRATYGFHDNINIWEIEWPYNMRGTHAVIGVATSRAPLTCSGYKALLGSNDQSLGWNISENTCIYNDCVINSYPKTKPTDYRVGNKIIVILDLIEGILSFKDDSDSLGTCLSGLKQFKRNNQRLFPAVSTTYNGAVIGIRFLGNGNSRVGHRLLATGASDAINSFQNEVENIEKGIKDTLEMMKKKDSNEIESVNTALEKKLAQIYEKLSRQQRIMFGDKMAELDGGDILVKYLNFLNENGLDDETTFRCYSNVFSLIWEITDSSSQLASSLANNGIFEHLKNLLKKMKPKLQEDYKKFGRLLKSSVGTLCNCGKRSENRHYIQNVGLVQILVTYLDVSSNINDIIFYGYISFVFLLPNTEIQKLQLKESRLKALVSCLEAASKHPAFRCKYLFEQLSGGVQPHCFELVMAVGALAIHDAARAMMVEMQVISHLVTYANLDNDSYHQELCLKAMHALLAKETFYTILKEKEFSQLIVKLIKSEHDGVRQEALRVGEKIRNLKNLLSRGSSAGQIISRDQRDCKFALLCQKFVKSLDISVYLDKKFNLCFCAQCYESRSGTETAYIPRGEPPKDYGIPVGWFRFGLNAPARAYDSEIKAFDRYHRAFHGTSVNYIKPILREGQLLIPGDEALGGEKLGVKPGHFTENRKPTGFDIQQIFLSPSIRYVAHEAYAKPQQVQIEGKNYIAQTVLQALINPNSYQVGKETVGATTQIDPVFSNDELEWSTKQRGSIIIYGLLVRLTNTDDSSDFSMDTLERDTTSLSDVRKLGRLSDANLRKSDEGNKIVLRRSLSSKCQFASDCESYLNILGIRADILERKFNLCYCSKCYNEEHEPYYPRGNPPKDYGIPTGWCRFALKASSKAHQAKAFEMYHRAFFAVSANNIVKILNTEKLPLNDKGKIIVSPSVCYMGLSRLCPSQSFQLDDETYSAQLILATLIKPGSYEVGKATVSTPSKIDKRFDNNELEWSTKETDFIFIYGILIRLRKQD